MAATPSSLLAFSSRFQWISAMLLWFLLLAYVDAQKRTVEVQTLLRFKEMTEVDGWVLSKGYWSTWKETDNNTCAWAGVTCTTNFTVEQLSFSGWELKRLPSLSVLSNLIDLRELDLSWNNFGGISIPDDIGSLVGLAHLDLAYSAFSGPIPSNISACRSLQYISFASNQLTGEIPDLSGLANLKYLILSQNQLSGPFPIWLGKLDSPLKIDLSGNVLNGTIPSLSNLTNLLELLLDNNTFTGFEGVLFPDAKNLEHLSVSGNQLQGPMPHSITKFLNLKTLDLSRNQLDGPIPPGFSLNMSGGIWFDFSRNQLSGNIPESLLQPTQKVFNLPGLKFAHNNLTGRIPFDGTQQYNYYVIDFSHNKLSGPIPPICKNGSSSFYQFWLHFNDFSGDIVPFLAQCSAHINDMQLANNSFSGDLSRLASISTSSDFDVTESILQIVDLSNNNLRLGRTEVNTNPLKGLLEFFGWNVSLTEFRMQGTDFNGTHLPEYFSSSAGSLEVLDLSNNGLHGEISDAAFNSTWLPALGSLNLSNNDLIGPVPNAIVLLPNLKILDVSNNSLSGPLPAGLPDIFYNPSFYVGNGGLCGGPLQSCPHWIGIQQWWVLLIIIGGSVIIAVGSFLGAMWRWRVYHRKHQQDADLIKMLLERETAAVMSLRDLKKATDNFADRAQIGEGGFGIVYTGKLSDGTIVAIKKSKREGSQKEKEQFLNEVRILSQVNHRHLVKLLGCCMENKVALLVFEFVSNGTLEEHLQRKLGKGCLSWKQRLHIAVQTADALNYLHSAASFPIYHRDVKSANILIDDELNAKVADFGISKLAAVGATHVTTRAIQGTIGYIDPEYHSSYQLTDKSDVYSFGVVLLELISAKPTVDYGRGGKDTGLAFFAKKHIESGDLQQLIDADLAETYNDLASHGRESILNVGRLAMKCLRKQSKVRPSMNEVSKELQKLWVQIDGTSEDVGSLRQPSTVSKGSVLGSVGQGLAPIFSENSNEHHQHDHIVLLSDLLFSNGSSFIPHSDATGTQMEELSNFTRVRSRSSQ